MSKDISLECQSTDHSGCQQETCECQCHDKVREVPNGTNG